MESKASPDGTKAVARRGAIVFGSLTIVCVVLAMGHAWFFGHLDLQYAALVPLSFVSLGMLIKYGDQSYDSDCFDRRKARLLALPCGIWLGGLILFDADSATIFIGLLIALLVAAKYDNTAFKVGFAVAGIFSVISFIRYPDNASVLGVLVIFITALLDEKVNDLADTRKDQNWAWRLLRERPFMKMAILVLCLAGVLSSYLYLFAFLAFDLGYTFVDKYAIWRCEPVTAAV